MTQLSIFDQPTGAQLRDAGIKQALDHAEEVTPEWPELAYKFLCDYIRKHPGEFMTEDVRQAAAGIVPEPPSLRAWGGVIVKAAKSGLIVRAGYGQVTNVNAHRANASVWVVKGGF